MFISDPEIAKEVMEIVGNRWYDYRHRPQGGTMPHTFILREGNKSYTARAESIISAAHKAFKKLLEDTSNQNESVESST